MITNKKVIDLIQHIAVVNTDLNEEVIDFYKSNKRTARALKDIPTEEILKECLQYREWLFQHMDAYYKDKETIEAIGII